MRTRRRCCRATSSSPTPTARVVPRDDASIVLEKARAVAKSEVKKIKEFDEGKYIPDWLAETLRQKGCEIVED